MARFQRGLNENQEQDPGQLIRDTRTLGRKIYDFFQNTTYVAIFIAMLAAASFMIYSLCDLFLIIGVICFIYTYTRRQTLPFKIPQRAALKDYNDCIPGTVTPRKSRGICFFGNDKENGDELWFTNEDMRTHVLIFGSTGSGKTEALISLAFNTLTYSSGFIYVDGKGDNSLFSKVFSMARKVGRDDDVLLINFMTGAKDVVGPQERRLSNTMNPFATGSSSMLSQLVISLMDQAAGTPDGDMWKGRAISFVEALMKVLTYARDAGYILLDAHTVRRYFTLDKVESIAIDKALPRDNQESVSLAAAPPVVLEPIMHYLDNLPGYDPSKKGKPSPQTLEQHGFITMQLTRVFTSLADTYGHILRTKLAEVDMKDVVLNRRILVVLLPAMEKSPDELSNLGKVIIATLKAMMAAGLGSQVEGTHQEVIQRKPTTAPTPFMCVLDEYGYYAVPGFAVVPAQARSLGFSVIFAGQDLPAFQKASKEEAASIGANTNIKIAMKLEDPIETWDFFAKTAGESYVTKVDNFQADANKLTNAYMDVQQASAEKRARIDLLDLKEQIEGDAHIFFKSKIVRARMFYADPKTTAAMRLNHFLRIDKPPSKVVHEIYRQFKKFEIALNAKAQIEPPELSDDIETIIQVYADNPNMELIERGVNSLIKYYEKSSQSNKIEALVEAKDDINVFMKVPIPDFVNEILDSMTVDPVRKQFNGILLNKNLTRDKVGFLERMSGKSEQNAANIAEEVIKDMTSATEYPPEPLDVNIDEYVQMIRDFIVDIGVKKKAHAEEQKKAGEKESDKK